MGRFVSYMLLLSVLVIGQSLSAFTANKVLFEFLDTGQYRVTVGYTIPSLREYREAYVLFTNKKEADVFYWKLVRGADFYPSDPKALRFVEPKSQPDPW